MKMPLPDAIISAVMGYVVVFIGLVLLMAVIAVLGKVMNRKKAEPAPLGEREGASGGTAGSPGSCAAEGGTAVPQNCSQLAPGSAGEVKLFDVPDREAAMLMAIVADKMGKPLNELRFQSIKEVK